MRTRENTILQLCLVLTLVVLSSSQTLRGRRHVSSSTKEMRKPEGNANITNHYFPTMSLPEERNPEQKARMDVVGGENVPNSDEARYYVALMERIGGEAGYYRFRQCAGSLISSRHVLTAAHCVEGRNDFVAKNIEAVLVRAFKLDENGASGSGDSYFSLVESYTIPTFYVPKTLTDDVAIITMKTPISFQDLQSKYRPVSLATKSVVDETSVTVYGLGRTAEKDKTQVTTLQKGLLQFISAPSCVQYHGTSIDPTCMVCAGYWDGKIDACNGDSGGPLVISDTTKQPTPVQVGIVSWGKGCARVWAPGVYTSVVEMRPWIEENTCPKLSAQEKGILSLCISSQKTDSGEPQQVVSQSGQAPPPVKAPAPSPKTTAAPVATSNSGNTDSDDGECIVEGLTCEYNGTPCCKGNGIYCRPFYNSNGFPWFHACTRD